MKFSVGRAGSDLQGVKFPAFLLTSLVIVKAVLHYRAACDNLSHMWLQIETYPVVLNQNTVTT